MPNGVCVCVHSIRDCHLNGLSQFILYSMKLTGKRPLGYARVPVNFLRFCVLPFIYECINGRVIFAEIESNVSFDLCMRFVGEAIYRASPLRSECGQYECWLGQHENPIARVCSHQKCMSDSLEFRDRIFRGNALRWTMGGPASINHSHSI